MMRPTISFDGTVPPLIPVWVQLPPNAGRCGPFWAELGPVETREQYDSVVAVALEYVAELMAADEAADETPDGEMIGLDEWDALRRAIVAEGIRRCKTTVE